METPSDAAGSPAGTMVAQHPATLTATVRKERANLFLTGDFDALTATMSLNEQKYDVLPLTYDLLNLVRLLSTYFYQFWCFSLVTAQQWGIRAHPWTAETQEFARYGGIPDVGTSPQEVSTPGSRLHSLQQVAPSPFCRWAIHLNNPEMFFELQQTEASAAYWQPEVNLTPAFNELLGDALRTGSFTDVDPTSLPLGIPQIVNSSVRTPTELLTEALAFAIMGRNVDLLGNLLRTARKASLDLTGIRPLHLATSYIDGGSTCCLVVDIIMKHVLLTGSLKQFVINEYGHTVLDNLLLSILRSHTRTPIRGVDTALGQHARYAGQEVDICGRWTADSASFRALVASGTANIPLSWKHKFCHSSAQAVSHSAYVVLHHCPESLFSDSGLFQRRCPAPLCGKLLVLGPLHALVVTALHLVTSGYDGEDLFGVLSYYLTLIQAGVDAGAKAEVSVDLIVGSHTYEECSHEELTPTGLAGELQHRMQAWRVPESCVNGWGALLAVMELTENEQRTFNDIEEIQDGYSFRNWCVLNYGEEKRARWLNERPHTGPDKIPENMTEARDALHVSFPNKCDPWACRYYQEDEEEVPPGFRNSPMLGHVWAGVQAELGSYRRLGPEQNWISPQFSMERLWFSLKNSSKPDIGHLQDSDLQDYCRCGRFRHTEAWGIGIQSPQDVFE